MGDDEQVEEWVEVAVGLCPFDLPWDANTLQCARTLPKPLHQRWRVGAYSFKAVEGITIRGGSY